MKRLLLSTALIFTLSQISFASTSPATTPISSSKEKVKSEQIKETKDDCEVTRSSTASGTDCWGNPFTVRASCTASSTNCDDANTQAAGCAYSMAQLAAALIYDECS